MSRQRATQIRFRIPPARRRGRRAVAPAGPQVRLRWRACPSRRRRARRSAGRRRRPSVSRRRAPPAASRRRYRYRVLASCRRLARVLSSAKPCFNAARQRGIAVPIKFDEPHRGIFRSLRQRDRRPADVGAAPRSTSGVVGPTARPPVTRSPCGRPSSARLSQPDAPGRDLQSRFRARPARRNANGRDSGVATAWITAAFFSRYIRANSGIAGCSAKNASSGSAACGPARRQRDRTMQAGIIRIAYWCDGGKPIQRAAQDDDDQPRIAAVGGAGEFRQIGPGRKGGAAGAARARREIAGDLEPRRNPLSAMDVISSGIPATSAAAPAPAAAIRRARWCAASPVSRIRGDQFEQIARIDAVGEPGGDLRRDVEPQLDAFRRRPGRVACRKSVRPGGRPQRLAQRIEAAEIAAGIVRDLRQQPAGRRPGIVEASAFSPAAPSRPRRNPPAPSPTP